MRNKPVNLNSSMIGIPENTVVLEMKQFKLEENEKFCQPQTVECERLKYESLKIKKLEIVNKTKATESGAKILLYFRC